MMRLETMADENHRVEVHPARHHVQVKFSGETIASTTSPLLVFETGLPVRYYIPPQDVRMDFLKPSNRSTTCPYKGKASYWSIEAGGIRAEGAVWAYLDPIPACESIKGYLSFYPDRVELIVDNQH